MTNDEIMDATKNPLVRDPEEWGEYDEYTWFVHVMRTLVEGVKQGRTLPASFARWVAEADAEIGVPIAARVLVGFQLGETDTAIAQQLDNMS